MSSSPVSLASDQELIAVTKQAIPFSKKTLIFAFVAQIVIILICCATTIFIYLNFKHRLKHQLEVQQEQEKRLRQKEIQLSDAQKQIEAGDNALVVAADVQASIAFSAGKYDVAEASVRDGLQVKSGDAVLNWLLVKSLVLEGRASEALKVASKLTIVRDAANDQVAIQRNLLTLGLARCANHDDSGAVLAIQSSDIARFNRDEIAQFCSDNVRSKFK